MERQRFIFLTAFFLFIKEHGVSAQYATVLECLPSATATVARPIVQSASQYILPAIIQPIVPGYDSCGPDPGLFGNYGNFLGLPPGYPPVIVRDDDDLLRSLLYFLIFSMGNKRDNYYSAPCNGCSSGSGKCQCSCDCPNCSKKTAVETCGNAPIYIPVPIAIPVYTASDGCKYIDGFCNDILYQDPCDSCSDRDNEYVITIKTD